MPTLTTTDDPADAPPVAPDVVSACLSRVDAERATDLLARLLRVPSMAGTDAEGDAQHLVAAELRGSGLDVDLWQIDLSALVADPDFPGWEVERDQALGLVAATGPGRPALVLQGHTDVVPPGDVAAWHGDTFDPVLRAGSVHGRGGCDMKGGLVSNLLAVEAIQRARVRLRRPLAVHVVSGEEDGGLGAFATLRRGRCATWRRSGTVGSTR